MMMIIVESGDELKMIISSQKIVRRGRQNKKGLQQLIQLVKLLMKIFDD